MLIRLCLVLFALSSIGCSRTVVLTNTTERPVRASLERELMSSGDRTLTAVTVPPEGAATLGPVDLVSERVTLVVQPAGGLGGVVPIKERLGFGTSEFTIVADEFAPATIRLVPGTPETVEDDAESDE